MLARFAFALSLLLLLVGCAPDASYSEGTTVPVPSLLPDDAAPDGVEPIVLAVTSDDPSIVKVTSPDPTRHGYRGYQIVCVRKGTTNVRIDTSKDHYVVPVRVFHDFVM